MSTIAERVQAGCEYLDEIRPGWEHLIDLGSLNLHSCTDCVVGQLAGPDADLGIAALDDGKNVWDDDKYPADLGFDITDDEVKRAPEFGSRYAGLTDVWKQAIRARLSMTAAADARPVAGVGE